MTDAAVANDTELQNAAEDLPEAAETGSGDTASGDQTGLKRRGNALWDNLAQKPLILAGIAAGIALVITLMLTSGGSSDKALYYGLSERDAAEVVAELEKAAIPYQFDKIGNIRVPESQVYDARLKVAAAGLPRGTGQGLEFLDEAPEIGRSQFAEHARYHHALERELAKSIASLGSIEQARVHLALPKKSVFIRERTKPTASVVVHLYPGRVLDAGQVAAITHLVSSSIPDLANDAVTVVDQRGNLISKPQGSTTMNQSFERMEYTRRLEQHYIDAIEELLSPMVGGKNQVRAQVVADVDFSVQEETSELYDPKQRAVRSEQLSEESSGKAAGGIPGAVSNEPPPIIELSAENPGLEDVRGVSGDKTRVRQVRNYELSRTVRHERGQPGTIRRLSVAVVIGVKPADAAPAAGPGDDGEAKPLEYTPEQLDRLTELVKSAVGFDDARGDSVRVINAEFAKAPEPEPLPWYQDEATLDLIKLAVAVVIGLFILYTVVLPLMRSAMPGSKADDAGPLAAPEGVGGALGHDGELPPHHPFGLPRSDQLLLAENKGLSGLHALAAVFPGGLPDDGDYETYVAAAQYAAADDPVRAAQVLKRWIQDNV